MNDQLAKAGWERFESRSGYEELVSPLWFRRDADQGGQLVFGFKAAPKYINTRKIVHGGMLLGFADHVLGMTVWHAIGCKPCATLSLTCNFVAAAKEGEWVEGRGSISRITRSVVFIRGEVSVGDRTVLTASGVWKVLGAG